MDSVKTGEIQAYLMSLIGRRKKEKSAAETAKKYKTYLSSMFSAAIRLEAGVTHNPVRSREAHCRGTQKSQHSSSMICKRSKLQTVWRTPATR